MLSYPLSKNEPQRLKALYDYEILDTLSEKEYDYITRIAVQICNVPASLITFLDKDRQWFKSFVGVPMRETPRALSFCNYTILDPDNVLVVPDLRADERFHQNPMVTGLPNAVFYAGAPLVTPDGFVLGSICVLDAKVNNLTADQKDALKGLAQQVITRLELQKKVKTLYSTQSKLRQTNKSLKDFALHVSHDMKTPLANILLVSGAFQKKYSSHLDVDAQQFHGIIDRSAKELLVFIDTILIQSEKISRAKPTFTLIDSQAVLTKVIDVVAPTADVEIKLSGKFPKVPITKTSLQQVFQNIITNAIKYNDKEKVQINISALSDKTFHYFSIADNGTGIEKHHLSKIFKKRKTLNQTDRFGNVGTGLGLAAVKDILARYGGKIKVTSKKDNGSVFKVCIPFNN